MVVCPLMFKEKLTVKQITCFVMSTVGLVLITGTAGGGDKDLLGIAFGVGAAILYATVVLINKFIKGVTGIHRTFVQFLSAIVVLVPYVFLTNGFTIGYNPECIPGKGSAIFFHISDRPTAGCVGASEQTVVNLLSVLNPEDNPHILIF